MPVKENSFSAGKGGMHVESLTALMGEYHSCSPAEQEDILRVLEERRREGEATHKDREVVLCVRRRRMAFVGLALVRHWA